MGAGGEPDPGYHDGIRREPDGTITGVGTIRVQLKLTEEEVLEYADALVAAARRFRQVATELGRRLAAKLNVDMAAFANPLFRLEWDASGHNPIVPLDEEWTFWFHGFECLFSNRKTGQQVEVKFGYLNE